MADPRDQLMKVTRLQCDKQTFTDLEMLLLKHSQVNYLPTARMYVLYTVMFSTFLSVGETWENFIYFVFKLALEYADIPLCSIS